MTNMKKRLASLLFLSFVSQIVSAQDSFFAITNANLFNGVDNEISENATIFVRNREIERIAGPDARIPRAYVVIDAEGNYLMPGLFDVHTHISNLEQAKRALESGVTTVRTGSVSAYQDVAMRELVKSGKLEGPDVVAAGVFVTPDLGETVLADPRLAALHNGVNTDDELRMLVNINVDRGVDVIKTRGTQRAGLPDTDPRQQVYTERQLRVVVDEAAKHGIPVMVHAHGDEGARAAVLAGARSIEHGTYLSDETLGLMKERGTWMVPTYVTMDEMNEEQYDHVLRLRGKHMVPQLERAIRSAHSMGVRIATGADNYYDNKSINRISIEVEHYVLLQMEDRTGRIAAGYEADMILVPANPLIKIEALQDVLLVMSNGQVAVKRIPFGVKD